MGARSAIAVAVPVLLVAGAPATGSQPRAAGTCTVAPLSKTVLRHGAASVRNFRKMLARERSADLMGFRRGPRLPAPSPHERSQIEDARALRGQFGLNPSTLLIRRLIRDHTRRSQVSFLVPPLKVTALEERDLRFRDRVEKALIEVDRYVAHCARSAYVGLHVDAGRPWPAEYRVVVLFKGPLAVHRRALRTRFRYHSLLAVRSGATRSAERMIGTRTPRR